MTPPEHGAGGAQGAIDPRIRQRRVAVRRREGRRRLRWVVAVTVVVALVAATVGFLHTPWLSVRVVTVTGAHRHTSTSDIVAAAGLGGHPPMISVDPGATAGRVESLPFIAAAEVSRHWPDGIHIAVSERAPVVQMAGPAGSWSVLDGQGRTLQAGRGRLPGLPVLIVHTGRGGIPPAPVGHSLPGGASVGLAVARTLPAAFSAQVVSVTEAPDATVSLALDSGITVLLGTRTDLHTKYEDVAAIIAHGSLQGATTIDVTVPQSPVVSGS